MLKQILENPLYALLFGSGGVLAVVIALILPKNKKENGININIDVNSESNRNDTDLKTNETKNEGYNLEFESNPIVDKQEEYEDVKQLVPLYPNKYVAFFKDVIQDMFFSGFDLVVSEFEKKQGNFRLEEINNLVKKFLDVDEKVSLECLKEVACKRNSIKESNFE